MRLFFEGSQKHKNLAINGMPPDSRNDSAYTPGV